MNEEPGQLAISKKKSEGDVAATYFDNMWV